VATYCERCPRQHEVRRLPADLRSGCGRAPGRRIAHAGRRFQAVVQRLRQHLLLRVRLPRHPRRLRRLRRREHLPQHGPVPALRRRVGRVRHERRHLRRHQLPQRRRQGLVRRVPGHLRRERAVRGVRLVGRGEQRLRAVLVGRVPRARRQRGAIGEQGRVRVHARGLHL
ncbi:hypothetical protein DFJ74DRAFT_756924, partial [Hyaloraphidium curvatum]